MDHTRSRTSPGPVGMPEQAGDLADDDEDDQPEDEAGDDRAGHELRGPAQPGAGPPMSSPMPAPMASADVSATARAGSPWDMSATSEPVSTETVETGSDDEVRRGAQHGVGDEGQRDGVQADDDRDTGDARVAEGLGHGESRHHQARRGHRPR